MSKGQQKIQQPKLSAFEKTKQSNEIKKQLQVLMQWVTTEVENSMPPRFSDVIAQAHQVMGFVHLKLGAIRRALRLHPAYNMTAPQALKRKRWKRERPIVVKLLGCLHGDIGFFPIVPEYTTPATFQSGFLVCKDVLSRFTYISILIKTRDAASMVRAFTDIFQQFEKQNPGLQVVSLAFDKERSVVGNVVQQFLKDNNVSFHAFQNSRSKSKMAEGEIGILRGVIRKLRFNKEQRWWRVLQGAVNGLNQQPIRLDNKYIIDSGSGKYYTPASVNQSNVQDFISKLQKAVPSYYFNQFMVDPELINFKFKVGQHVRQKLIASSSAVIGEKRSDIALGETVFVIRKLLAYVSRGLTAEPLYVVENVNNKKDKEAFDEDEIAETIAP